MKYLVTHKAKCNDLAARILIHHGDDCQIMYDGIAESVSIVTGLRGIAVVHMGSNNEASALAESVRKAGHKGFMSMQYENSGEVIVIDYVRVYASPYAGRVELRGFIK